MSTLDSWFQMEKQKKPKRPGTRWKIAVVGVLGITVASVGLTALVSSKSEDKNTPSMLQSSMHAAELELVKSDMHQQWLNYCERFHEQAYGGYKIVVDSSAQVEYVECIRSANMAIQNSPLPPKRYKHRQ